MGGPLTMIAWVKPNVLSGDRAIAGENTSSATASALTKGNSFLWAGTNQWTGQAFDGVIDEVVVYNKTLSGDTIAVLYAAAAYGAEKAP